MKESIVGLYISVILILRIEPTIYMKYTSKFYKDTNPLIEKELDLGYTVAMYNFILIRHRKNIWVKYLYCI